MHLLDGAVSFRCVLPDFLPAGEGRGGSLQLSGWIHLFLHAVLVFFPSCILPMCCYACRR